MSFFNAGANQKNNSVVTININGVRLVGLITREDFTDLPNSNGGDDDVAVFLPFSYQIGGFTTIVPKSMIQPVDLSVEKGLRFVVTGGNPGKN